MTSEGASAELADAGVEGVRRGGRGRKLQLLLGRAATRVKISEIRRCWTDVSWTEVVSEDWGGVLGKVDTAYQLGIEFGQTRLAVVVEDQDGIDHCGGRLGFMQS